jgi:hypothetical protein
MVKEWERVTCASAQDISQWEYVNRPNCFLNISIPCYIFIKQKGYLRIIPCMFYMIDRRLNNCHFKLVLCVHMVFFSLFCRQCCRTFPRFSWSLVDVLTWVILIGNYKKKTDQYWYNRDVTHGFADNLGFLHTCKRTKLSYKLNNMLLVNEKKPKLLSNLLCIFI